MSKYPNSGLLGKNRRQRPGKKDPEYNGQCEIDGVEYWINAWLKQGADGGKFFSLSFTRKNGAKPASASPETASPDSDDDVPF